MNGNKVLRDKNIPLSQKRFWHTNMEAVGGIVITLIAIGSINVFSSSFILAETEMGSPYFFLQRQGINLVAGAVCFYMGWRFEYTRWRKVTPIIFWAVMACLVGVLLAGLGANGSQRWLGVGGFTFQPAEFAKVAALLMIADYLALTLQRGRAVTPLTKTSGMIMIMAVLIEMEPDMGTALVVAGVPLLLMMMCGMGKKWITGLIGVCAVLFALMVNFYSYRLNRLSVWYDPWSDAANKGYQAVSSITAVGSGGLFGMGLGTGLSKYSYLPEAHTDFAFAVFSQETGFFMVLSVLIMYSLLAYYSLMIAKSAKDYYGHLLAAGITMLIAGQAVFNIMMVVGIMPVVGIPLPFISYGGSSLMTNMFLIGLLLSIGRVGEFDRLKRLAAAGNQQVKMVPQRPFLRFIKR